ncbi:putative ABC transport system ATP-binding protein [Caloramator fervidus]|uniref:Putative ABC transport system ATP-binding protein n=1 Tax=Caloramator fervidus TaxID=29344 RepID=A0A1H5VGR2_9CLOT|nr:energy-coupling factor ABC transporter ATP-binding protein [Caloramator fervidus]SEF86545.1 putative ABC transport system ATP-binding protein [Caloramator fervidus]
MFKLTNVKYKNILNIDYLEIEKNKITCIIGESGSGKTTLVRLLNKMISYDQGEIYFKERSLKDWDSIELRRKVSMLSQNPVMFKGNIRDNLLIGLKFSQRPLVEDEVLKEILNIVKLDKDLDENIYNLSGGEKQRVALGRILLLPSYVYILDEPTSALDEKTEDEVIKAIIDYVKKNNRNLIMVTHSKKIAINYGERVIEVSKGKIKE